MAHNTNFIFFGSPEFAAYVLQKLISAGYAPSLVVCNPDKPAGRKKIITPPPVKTVAEKHKIPVLQPEKLDPSLFIIPHSSFDFFIVAAYANIIPQEILNIPKKGTIGVHPSLLPKYRGASPIQSAIINGETSTGTTLYLMDDKVDHGPILAQQETSLITNYQLPVSQATYSQLEEELANRSVDLLIQTLPQFISGTLVPKPQNEAGATYTKKFKTEDGFIEYDKLKEAMEGGGAVAEEIDRKIRALAAEPSAYTIIDGKRIKLIEAKLIPSAKAGNYKLHITRLIPEGKKSMTWEQFKITIK